MIEKVYVHKVHWCCRPGVSSRNCSVGRGGRRGDEGGTEVWRQESKITPQDRTFEVARM